MKKFQFRFERDDGNRHYSYLVPMDQATFNFVSLKFEPLWDGLSEPSPVIIMYNGRIINRKA